jgi:undecaprenyl diphosphate synthase
VNADRAAQSAELPVRRVMHDGTAGASAGDASRRGLVLAVAPESRETDRPESSPPRHVAIIMDGNGRWAVGHGQPRVAGHMAGAKTVRRIVEHARRSGVPFLTLYAFSSDNWRRPENETGALMKLFRRYLAAEVPRCLEFGIRLSVIGRRDRLPPALVRQIAAAERVTAHETGMRLRLAVDYSSRDVILRAARESAGHLGSRDAFASAMASVSNDVGDVPDVDLLIRTGGQQRLSDFLLWECAYAELVFSWRMWPEFTPADFDAAIAEYASRTRRFGGLEAVAG